MAINLPGGECNQTDFFPPKVEKKHKSSLAKYDHIRDSFHAFAASKYLNLPEKKWLEITDLELFSLLKIP